MTAYMKKFDLNFYVHTKVDTCAEFQLSGLIFIFLAVKSCYQLLTADDSSYEKKLKWDFHFFPECDVCA